MSEDVDQTELDNEEDSQDTDESSSSIMAQKQAKLEKFEEIIEAIPVLEQKEEARLILRELTRVIERPSQLNPETARIITESVDKDNQRKFEYLSQKQKDSTEIEKEELDFRRQKYSDSFSLVKPIVIFVLGIVAVCIFTGIWLSVNGQPTLGASLITGSLSAVLSYAAGFGTSKAFKDDKS